MSREEHRSRVPTSEELERQGAVAPPDSAGAGGRRGLLGFLRVGRIRVSGDVAARKYIPADPHSGKLVPPSAPAPKPIAEASPMASAGAETLAPPPYKQHPAPGSSPQLITGADGRSGSLTPRRIRIDESVRERRGMGGDGPRSGLLAASSGLVPAQGRGEDWTDAEVTAVVEDYLQMLAAELAGRAYSKAEHRRRLRPRLLPGRSQQAIEFKHANISAVLNRLGLPYISGYQPRGNYQAKLLPEIRRQLGDPPTLDALIQSPPDRAS